MKETTESILSAGRWIALSLPGFAGLYFVYTPPYIQPAADMLIWIVSMCFMALAIIGLGELGMVVADTISRKD